MKKFIALLLAIVILGLCGCNKNSTAEITEKNETKDTEETTSVSQETTTNSEETETTPPEIQKEDPVDAFDLDLQTGELSEEALQAFGKMFSGQGTYGTKAWWYNMALSCYFAAPEYVNLDWFFTNGFDGETISQEEEELLTQMGIRVDRDTKKNPREKMDQVLKTYFGISLEQTKGVGLGENWDEMPYVEETDSYYADSHGYVSKRNPKFTKGHRTEDGKVVLFYPDGVETSVLTLVEAPEGAEVPYYVYSNISEGHYVYYGLPDEEKEKLIHAAIHHDTEDYIGKAPAADVTAKSPEEVFSALRGSQYPGEERTFSVKYGDLTFVHGYFGDYADFTYQVWYKNKLIAGSREMFSSKGEYCNGAWSGYAVTYQNSEAFAFIYFEEAASDYVFHFQVVDTKGNVLLDYGSVCPTFDEETATLAYSVVIPNPAEDPNDGPDNWGDDWISVPWTLSLEKSQGGEPMIKVLADPNNADFSFYE